MDSNMAMGLRFPGRAFWACPQGKGYHVEALVTLPPGQDKVNMCEGYLAFPRKDDLEIEVGCIIVVLGDTPMSAVPSG